MDTNQSPEESYREIFTLVDILFFKHCSRTSIFMLDYRREGGGEARQSLTSGVIAIPGDPGVRSDRAGEESYVDKKREYCCCIRGSAIDGKTAKSRTAVDGACRDWGRRAVLNSDWSEGERRAREKKKPGWRAELRAGPPVADEGRFRGSGSQGESTN